MVHLFNKNRTPAVEPKKDKFDASVDEIVGELDGASQPTDYRFIPDAKHDEFAKEPQVFTEFAVAYSAGKKASANRVFVISFNHIFARIPEENLELATACIIEAGGVFRPHRCDVAVFPFEARRGFRDLGVILDALAREPLVRA